MDRADAEDAPPRLNAFCLKEREGWHLLLHAGWLPDYLEDVLNVHRETRGAWLDFDDLERHMSAAQAPYDKRSTRLGGVELEAEGAGAEALAEWFVTAIASGIRR
jgi:hypothetical protein